MAIIDLSQLPAPAVVETLDYEAILAERKDYFVSLHPADQQDAVRTTLELESEPITKLLQENAYRELVWRQRVNDAARGVMLAFAEGEDLEQIAANCNVRRLTITPADDTTVPPTPTVMEGDDSLRERAQEAFEGLSVAGPTKAYEFFARSADGRVADARAISPAGAEVVVSVLSHLNDGTADESLLAAVRTALSGDDTRPLGDRLTVQSATIVPYRIRATLYLASGPAAEPILDAAGKRADTYRTTRRRIGRDINRSAITAALHVEGVEKLVLHEPAADVALDLTQAGYCTGVDIVNGGTSE
ncbi:baseplate assembly protein [Ralstonia pseudosolanacearum]|uniref:baseplate assembly protein n=1 Tax=Ralstonia pseudosolanacearum TaxID=1310165 RepID=UPI000E585663|nr:baseplate assembly protein [Ralstonia pseudosolanacearum]AXW01375.1 baseplate assembly protein [Ralstonia solanacearum]AXW28854.1 baseplate assembly protein [Ralstonia solanacearum]AXW47640.1 baseplate assembly protein [Ralstonia solanacearum]NJZ67924.1 baseplate assembly protein [Ralstonia solanacearum]NJZ77736.1 baseplate assembly protein [Ralstonia solanacearum]